jgi:hypothetical protein
MTEVAAKTIFRRFICFYTGLNVTLADLSVVTSQRRHKKISAQTEFPFWSSTALLKSFEASRDDKSEPITAQAPLAVEAQAGIVNDYGAVR